MRTQVLICCQPIPNSPQSSKWAFSRPILVRVSRVQALALAMLGEPVRAGADAVVQGIGELHDVGVAEAFLRGCGRTWLSPMFPARAGGRRRWRLCRRRGLSELGRRAVPRRVPRQRVRRTAVRGDGHG